MIATVKCKPWKMEKKIEVLKQVAPFHIQKHKSQKPDYLYIIDDAIATYMHMLERFGVYSYDLKTILSKISMWIRVTSVVTLNHLFLKMGYCPYYFSVEQYV